MFFYLLFGAAIALGGQNMALRAGLIVSALVVLAVAGFLIQAPGWADFYTYNIILEFAFGIGLGMLYLGGGIARSKLWWLAAALGALLLATPLTHGLSNVRALDWGVPAALIVAGCLFAPAVRAKPLERLGDWSYALYLSHPIILSAARQSWARVGGDLPLILFLLLAMAACLVAAAILYRLVELPTKDWLKGRMGGGRKPEVARAAAS